MVESFFKDDGLIPPNSDLVLKLLKLTRSTGRSAAFLVAKLRENACLALSKIKSLSKATEKFPAVQKVANIVAKLHVYFCPCLPMRKTDFFRYRIMGTDYYAMILVERRIKTLKQLPQPKEDVTGTPNRTLATDRMNFRNKDTLHNGIIAFSCN